MDNKILKNQISVLFEQMLIDKKNKKNVKKKLVFSRKQVYQNPEFQRYMVKDIEGGGTPPSISLTIYLRNSGFWYTCLRLKTAFFFRLFSQ